MPVKIFLVSIFVACAILQGAVPLKIFLLAGQSNMSGWTSTNGIPQNLTLGQPRALIHADGEIDNSKKRLWMRDSLGFGHAFGWFGPEITFGKTMTDSIPGTVFGLIKYSVGGTYLATQWRPPSSGGTVGNLYQSFMAEIDNAMSAVNTTLYTPEFSGICWMQGEFDAGNLAYANEYQTNLTNFIRDVRTKTGNATLPFVIAKIDSVGTWPYNGIVRAAETNVARTGTNVLVFDTHGYPTDNTHYLLNGMIQLGQDFAKTFLSRFKATVTPIRMADRPSKTGEHSLSLEILDLNGRVISTQRPQNFFGPLRILRMK